MTLSSILVFVAAYAIAVASPGPGVAAVIARALGHGLKGMLAFIAGFFIGDVVWMLVAVAGLGVVAQTYAEVLTAIKWVGAAYLLYLAWKLWTSPAKALETTEVPGERDNGKLFFTSLTLTLGNPKPIIFFMAVLPSIIDLTSLTPVAVAELLGVISVTIGIILFGYAFAADRARRFFKSQRSVRLLNRGSGAVMAGAAVAIAST